MTSKPITRRLVAVLGALGLGAVSLGDALAADAGAGEQVARQTCATCHQLPDGSGNAVGPSFTELAASNAIDADKLRSVLNASPHSSMVEVSSDTYGNMAAYISSLN